MNKRSRPAVLAGGMILAVMLSIANTARAANALDYLNQVWAQLEASMTAAGAYGYDLEKVVLGDLGDDEVDSWTFTLQGGVEYEMHGVCDTDCSDLDIRVTDRNGNVLAADTTTDDIPIVTFTPRRTGDYNFDITMYDCSAGLCYFGFALYTTGN